MTTASPAYVSVIPSWGKAGRPATRPSTTLQGPILADPITRNLYDVYAAGEPGIQKATGPSSHNNIYVAQHRHGKTWTTSLVYHAPLFTALNNLFPSLAVDPMNGKLYAAWSDGQNVSFAASSDQASSWSVVGRGEHRPEHQHGDLPLGRGLQWQGRRRVLWHDPIGPQGRIWIGDERRLERLSGPFDNGGDSFTRRARCLTPPTIKASSAPQALTSPPGTRNLLDLFQVAIDPQNGRAAIVYTDDTLTKDPSGNPLPQIVLAYE